MVHETLNFAAFLIQQELTSVSVMKDEYLRSEVTLTLLHMRLLSTLSPAYGHGLNSVQWYM